MTAAALFFGAPTESQASFSPFSLFAQSRAAGDCDGVALAAGIFLDGEEEKAEEGFREAVQLIRAAPKVTRSSVC